MGSMTNRYLHALAVCALLLAVTGVQAASIIGSKHDISTAGQQVCIHCHTPHNASTQEGLIEAPLWNRKITNLNAFTPYSSPTMTETCATRPSGISLACLSCHDGTGAGSAVYGGDQHNKINWPTSGGGSDANCMKCHWTPPEGVIYSKALTVMGGSDLRNDHPISMPYPTANANFWTPPDAAKGWTDLKLYNGKIECPSCHAVHDPAIIPFLSTTNVGSAMCLKCHKK